MNEEKAYIEIIKKTEQVYKNIYGSTANLSDSLKKLKTNSDKVRYYAGLLTSGMEQEFRTKAGESKDYKNKLKDRVESTLKLHKETVHTDLKYGVGEAIRWDKTERDKAVEIKKLISEIRKLCIDAGLITRKREERNLDNALRKL